MVRYPTIALVMAICAFTCAQAEASVLVRVPELTMDTALHIAQVAIKTCRTKGVSVAATVLDRGGNAQIVLRDTFAPTLTLMVSRQKAFTALSFNTPTSRLNTRANTPIGRLHGLLMSAGGVPILAGGQLIGAIGVSGAPSGLTDQACAVAGVAAVQDALDMVGNP